MAIYSNKSSLAAKVCIAWREFWLAKSRRTTRAFLVVDKMDAVRPPNNGAPKSNGTQNAISTPRWRFLAISVGVVETVQAVRICEALQKGEIETVNDILSQQDVKLKDYNSHFGNLLHLAASFGQPEIIKSLVEREVDVNAQTVDGSTPLHLAAKAGRLAVAEALLGVEHVDDTLQDSEGKTPYEVAKTRSVAFTIEYARSLYITRKTKEMFRLAEKSDINGLRKMFEDNRNQQILSINTADSNGDTVLHRAAKLGHLELISFLFGLGVDAYLKNRKGKMAIELAKDELIRSALKEGKISM
jgi:oxysterol-binding protein 1